MRTKNLNLKKKLAFIASVAMIASTAAYLPADFAKDIGVGIVASAGDDDVAVTSINTFTAYLKVNNKYVGFKQDAGTGNTYKFYRTISELNGESAKPLVLTDVDDSNVKAFTVLGTSDTATFNQTFTVKDGASGVVTLPKVVEPGSVISIDVVAKSTAAVVSTSNKVEVTLDEHGMGKVGTITTPVEIQGDNLKTNSSGNYNEGDRELINFSNLKFCVDTATDTYNGFKTTPVAADGSDPAHKHAFSATINKVKTPAHDDSAAVLYGVANFDEIVKNDPTEGAEKSYEYAYVADGTSWARNFVGQLDTEAAPDTAITVDLDLKNNWTVSGRGIQTVNGKKVLSLSLGSDGTATSGVITVTKDDVTEKFVVTVKNGNGDIDNTQLSVLGSQEIFGTSSGAVAFGGEKTTLSATTGNYRITSEKKVQAVSGSNNFVTLYTIANNSNSTASETMKFSASNTDGVVFADGGTAEYDCEINGSVTKESNDATEGTASVDVTKFIKNGNTVIKATKVPCSNVAVVKDGNTWKVKSSALEDITTKNTSVQGSKYVTIEVTSEAGKGANAKTPVLKMGNSYFQFDITTTYEIKVDDNNYPSGSATTTYGKATVTGTHITKPTEPTKAGFTFDSYRKDSTSGTLIFSKGYTVQQDDKATTVNPNMTLVAKYTANDYNMVLEANGGYFAKTSDYTKTVFDSKNRPTELTKTTNANSDIDVITFGTTQNVKKAGYVFVGWSTKANGTEDDVLKTGDDLDAIRPAAVNGTLKLYAVYKAEEYRVTFNTLSLEDDGSNSNEALVGTYTSVGAEFASGTNSTVYVKTGEAFGDLPTPVKKGYEFVGWYLKKDTTPDAASADKKYSAVSVSSTKQLAYEDLEGTEGSESLVLYAKFRQAKYNLTFDLDGGAFNGSNGSDFKEIAYYKINGSNNSVEFYDENNKKITFASDPAHPGQGEVASTLYDAKKGSGAYFEFKGWNVGTDTSRVFASGLATKIGSFTTATDLTIKAVFDQVSNVSGKGYYALENNKGVWYKYEKSDDGKNYTATTSSDKIEIVGTKNSDLAEEFDKNLVTIGSTTYALMRPGYTFDAWYTDEACTEKFDFSNAKYPDETEVTLYAGWKPSSTTSYTLQCLLVDGDGSVVTNDDSQKFPGDDINNPDTNKRTYVGATGSIADASKISITYNGKKYVFDAERSAEYETSAEIKAEWKTGGDYTVNTGTAGKLAAEGKTVIYGVFAEEGTVEKTLGTATNVKADNGTVTFTAAANADHYKVQKTWTVNGVEKTATGAAFTGTTGTYNVPTGDYKIAIVAYNADGSKSTVSAAVEVKGAAVTLGKATNLNVKDGTVTFTAAAGADHYRVQKTYTVNGTTKTAKGSKFTSTTGTFGVPEGDYKIAIIAYADAAETQFTVSDAKEVKAATIDLEAVDTASITVNRGTGEVSWTASKGAKEYVVFKIVKENGKSKIYGGRRTSETTYKFANFPTDDFKVYIASIDANENKVYSATKKISTLPSATNVKVSDDYKTVSWTKATGDKADKIVKYQVAKFDSTTNKYSYGTKVDASQSSFTLGVKAKAGQQIFVIAFDADGNSSYSDAITVK